MDLVKSLKISVAGMRAQGVRLRVIAENLANADSVPKGPGIDPFRRKVVSFENRLDRALGVELIRVDRVSEAKGDFIKRYDPNHPSANANGYIQLPNVQPMIEMMDFREAQRTYEANLGVLEVSKRMIQNTINMLN